MEKHQCERLLYTPNFENKSICTVYIEYPAAMMSITINYTYVSKVQRWECSLVQQM